MQGALSSSERALLVLDYLVKPGISFPIVYRIIERVGIGITRTLLSSGYHTINILTGENATPQYFIARLGAIASIAEIKAIDVIINMHGEVRNDIGCLIFYSNQKVNYCDLEIPVHARQKLRLLYSTACYGATGNMDWLNNGFKSAIGAKGININGATEYPLLLNAWVKGLTISQALQMASGTVSRLPDKVMRLMGQKKIDSLKVLSGDNSCTININ